ncbi:ankyrin and armadillo repeat-containing protein isoform X2 [Brachyhypopomus gauderio]|uniref:ankyrin and armadillo repeat-containing protein isoform X2 n=1 Tax=Brachyhypopomus gauderio TaxID=698409 RepID=UPI004042C3B6
MTMDRLSLNSASPVRLQTDHKSAKAFRLALAAQRNASAFFEKYDRREVQELLTLTTCNWLLCPEDFIQPVDAPPGIIKQMNNFAHTNAIILAPFDSNMPLDYKVVHQILRELTVGIYCFNQVPLISLEANYDQSTSCQLSPAYCDTKIGQILINIDYTMKALWHGAYIPKEKRTRFSELWRSSMGVDTNGIPQTKKDVCAEFLTAGLVDPSDDPCYQGIYDSDTNDRDPTYEPNSAEEQKLFSQHVDSVLLKMTSRLTSVRQRENLFAFEGTHGVSSVVRRTEEDLDLAKFQQLQQRLARHARTVKTHLGQKAELGRDLTYLKLIGFLVPFLISLRKKMRIPDLSRTLPPLPEDKLKTERELPPLLLGPEFSCKHFPFKPDQYFHLHGAIEFDVGTPELGDITEEMKEAFTTLQSQAAHYLNDLLRQDTTYKSNFPIPLSEIDGKSYCVISVEMAPFCGQQNVVQWWEAMNTAIKTQRQQRLPLSDTELHEDFKKTFGYGKAIKCKNVPYGLRAAAERGLSSVFHTLSRKNSPSHLGALDEHGYSLLHHAAMCNHANIICQLVAAGVDLNQARRGGSVRAGPTPLQLAARCGSLQALSCLLALQADHTQADGRGWMAVHFAAFYGQVACVQVLCRRDPAMLDAHTCAEYRATPLLLSAMSGSVDALDFLLSSGADWRGRDSKGNDAVQLAVLYFHTDVLRCFVRLNLDDLPVWKILVEMLQSQEPKRQQMAARCLEALSINTDSFWKHIMEAGGIAALVTILRDGRPLLQCMAAAVLCPMTEHVPAAEELVRLGAVPVLIHLLGSPQAELHSRCTLILADLAAHSPQYQIHIGELGGVVPVVCLLTSDLQDVLVNTLRCVRALCCACTSNQATAALSGAIPHLVELLSVSSEQLQEEACLALAELARGHRDNQELICGAGVVTPLVKVLRGRKMSVQVKAANALEAIVHQNPAIQQCFLKRSADRQLLHLLKVFQQDVREQAATALWALAGSTLKQKKEMAKLIGYHFILDMLLSSSDKMQYVGCQAVIALSYHSHRHQRGLCRENGVPPLVRLLRGARTTERTLLSVLRALGTLCIGVAHTNNANSQMVIYEEKAIPTLLELLQSHKSVQVKVQVSHTLACILMGNQDLQKAFWEHEDFSYDTIVNLLQDQDQNVRLEAGHALAQFAYNNPAQQTAIKQRGGVSFRAFEPFLNSANEMEQAKASFQIVVLAKVITDSDQVTLTARGITTLVELLASGKPDTVITTGQLLASLSHTRAGLPAAIVTAGAIVHLCAHLYSEDEEVRSACASALGYLTFNRHAHRLLLVECRNNPVTYKLLMGHLVEDAKICRRFISEFKRQRTMGLPALSLEVNGGPPVRQYFSKGLPKRRTTSHSRSAFKSALDRTRSTPALHRFSQRSRTAEPRVRYVEGPSHSSRPTLETPGQSNAS